jgi:hydroxypyruvate reductase
MTAERQPEVLLRELLAATLEHASPENCLPGALPPAPAGRTVVVAVGKAAASMAAVVESRWQAPLSGLAVTAYGHGRTCDRIAVFEAGHPMPDARSAMAARKVLDAVSGLEPKDLVLCLLSGGGSSLLALPAEGVSLENKQAVTRQLLRSGATIHEINCVRKHLSAIKGGRLAAACAPAAVVTLTISDVDDDDPAVIASGPMSADPSTLADARDILRRYAVDAPDSVLRHLESPLAETLKPGDERFDNQSYRVIASPASALQAAVVTGDRRGLDMRSLGLLGGEARMLGARHARLARNIADQLRPGDRPVVLVSGGETTVTVRGSGRGGRNSEYALALAIGLQGHDRIYALAADTDGIDGCGDNAGCFVRPDTLERAATARLDPAAALLDNDALGFFGALGDLLVTGPTLTNVNDFRAIYISPRAA